MRHMSHGFFVGGWVGMRDAPIGIAKFVGNLALPMYIKVQLTQVAYKTLAGSWVSSSW